MKPIVKCNGKIQSVGRALDILEALSNAQDEMALNEIAVMTGLNVSTCHHIVQTLTTRGYVSQVQRGRGYTLGSRVLELSSNGARQFSLVGIAMPELKRLNQIAGENVHLAILKGNDLVVLAELDSPRVVRVVTGGISYASAAHATALGKAILAWLPEQEVIRLLEQKGQTKFTENTITERHDLMESLRHVRRFGYALDEQEFLPGVMSISTALRDSSGTVLGSLGCTFPQGRANEDHLAALKVAVKECVGSLAAKFGRPLGHGDVNERNRLSV